MVTKKKIPARKSYDYRQVTTIAQAYAHYPFLARFAISMVVKALKFLPAALRDTMINAMNLDVVTYVLNNDDATVEIFEPNYNDSDQKKWGPWCIGGDGSGSGFRFHGSVWAAAHASADGGARSALRDQGRLDHMKKYFPEVYKAWFLRLKAEAKAAKKIAKKAAPKKTKKPTAKPKKK